MWMTSTFSNMTAPQPPEPSLSALDCIDTLVQSSAWSCPAPATAVLPPTLLSSLDAAAQLLPASPDDPGFQPFVDTVRECGRSALAKCAFPLPPPSTLSNPLLPPPAEHPVIMTQETQATILAKIDGFVSLYKTRLKPYTAPRQPTHVSHRVDLGTVARAHVGTAAKVMHHVTRGAAVLKRLKHAETLHPSVAPDVGLMDSSKGAVRRRSRSGGANAVSKKRRKSGSNRSASSSRTSIPSLAGRGGS